MKFNVFLVSDVHYQAQTEYLLNWKKGRSFNNFIYFI